MVIDHREENFQNGLFDLDDVAAVESNNDSMFVYLKSKIDDDKEGDVHLFRTTCAITFKRNFHSMIMMIG